MAEADTKAAEVTINDTVVQAAIGALGTVALGIFAAVKVLQGKRDELKSSDAKNLDDAQQKLLDTAISERDKARTELHAIEQRCSLMEDRHEQKITGLHIENDLLRERWQREQDAAAILRQEVITLRARLIAMESVTGIIGTSEPLVKLIEEPKP